ncbi:TPA: hypothetical protein N0F65_006800 [Lagenidium giganteum]|uniref:Branchpoint-bridging protein n=1 Tax=Lagenidium giganteum TaxID=4803 RepID=A0AAV2ZBB3_9STRA|nr:TPA: hypothetical protein N0F65_006800 [Lagenidium giganteum]
MADGDGSNGFMAFMASLGGKKPSDSNGTQQNGVNEASSNSTPGKGNASAQDEYSYEEEQEREAMMKSYHHPMKQWFRENAALQDKYGAFPLFWQDLKTWQPYREVLKQFLRATDSGSKLDEVADANASANDTATSNTSSSDGAKAQENSTAASTAATSSCSGDGEQPKRRRKSRWGDPVEDTASATADEAGGERKRKKSRWAPQGATPLAGAAAANNLLSQQQQQSIVLRAKLDSINQQLVTVAADAARIEKDINRSPSPPPQYDSNGKRTNTREVRMRAALERKRQDVMDQLVKINPLFRPPADYMRQKLSRKIYIPIREFPNYNFIGLIIGPRGNTQKRMEKETNCKIAIRGKGSVKEGSKGKKMNSDENDDLHVLITGDREDELERAAKEVQALLVPVDDTKNAHKQRQLRELALINGTLRDDDFCHVCGEKGHRQWECPNREKSFKTVNVKCAICGDSSHPTSDCSQKKKTGNEEAIDKEYNSFLQQLGEKPIISTANKSVASAPWLQPVKSSSAPSAAPWVSKQSAGAPGTGSAPPPPGTTQGPPGLGSTPATAYPPPSTQAAPVMGSTPATAYPPPTAPAAGAAAAGYGYGGYDDAWQQQQWAAYYAAGGTADYSQYPQYAAQYAQYGANVAAAGATGADQYQQYPPGYAANPPQ